MKNKSLMLLLKLKEYMIKYKKYLIIALIAIIIFISILILILNSNKNKIGNSVSNLYNGGIATVEGNKVYYIKYGENAGIYRLKNKKDKKITDGTAYFLNLYKGYIYYVELNEKTSEFNIIKMEENGKKKETFIKNVDPQMITVVDNWVFYFQNDKLYKIRTSKKDKIKITEENILNYTIKDDYIYYIYHNGERNVLARKTLEGKNFLKLAENVSTDFEIIGNKIYFIEQKYNKDIQEYEYKLFNMKTNGAKRKQILALPNDIGEINITAKALYYINTEDNALYQYKYKKGEQERLLLELKNNTSICIVKNIIFYKDLDVEDKVSILKIDEK